MVRALLEDEMRPVPGGQDVLEEIGFVDLPPDPGSLRLGLVVGEIGVPVEVRERVLKRRLPQGEEALDVPPPDVARLGIDVDREVEEVRGKDAMGRTAL